MKPVARRRVLPFEHRAEYVTIAALATILFAIVVGFLLGLIVGGFSVYFR